MQSLFNLFWIEINSLSHDIVVQCERLASDGNSVQTMFKAFNSHGNVLDIKCIYWDAVKNMQQWVSLRVQLVSSDRFKNNGKDMTDYRWLIKRPKPIDLSRNIKFKKKTKVFLINKFKDLNICYIYLFWNLKSKVFEYWELLFKNNEFLCETFW